MNTAIIKYLRFIFVFLSLWIGGQEVFRPVIFRFFKKDLIRFACLFLVLSVSGLWFPMDGTAQTISRSIATGNDDAEEEGVGGSSPGSVYLTSSDVELVYDPNSTQGAQIVGLRFTNITIPQGATITNAFLTFVADTPDSGNPSNSSSTTVTIRGHDTDNSSTFTSASNNISNRTTTTASVNWSPSSWTSNSSYNSNDISTIIQEIVDRSGWSSGNALSIIVTGTSSGGRSADSYNGSSSNAPEITISYTVPGPSGCSEMIINGEFDSGTSDWDLYNQSGNSSTWSVDNTSQLSGTNSARVNISSASGTDWHIQLHQGTFTINAGQEYTIYFDAKAAAARTMSFQIQERQSPWTVYFSDNVNLTTTATTYGPFTFTASSTETLAGLLFNLGASTQTVYIDNVKLLTNCTTSSSAKTAEVVFDNASSSSASNSTSLSFSHTVGTAKNRNLIVGLALENNPTVNYVRYGGQDLTILQSTVGPSFSSKAAIYQLINPPSGTATVEISIGSAEDIAAGALSFSNVKQSFTWRDLNSSQGTGTIPSEVNNAAEGDMVVDVVAAISPASATAGIQQVERWQQDAGTLLGMGSTEPGEASTTMSWNLNTSSQWSKSSISLVPEDTVMYCSNPNVATYTIQNNTDDAEEAGTDSPYSGSVTTGSNDLELVEEFSSANYGTMTVGLRFGGVNIPEGAIINNAYLTFRAISPDAPNTNNNVSNLVIKGHDADNPSTFSNTSNNISNRPTTSAATTWAPEAWSTGTDYTSPDLSAVIQEIVNRSGWSSGNAMAFIITGTGSRSAHSREGSTSQSPRLTIEYCTPSPGGIGSPTLWLKADTATSTQTNGAAVTEWKDISGNLNHASTTSNTGTGWTNPGTNPPAYRLGSDTKGINFNPSLDFAGSATLDGAGGLSTHQIFFVAKEGAAGTAIGYDNEVGNGGGGTIQNELH